MGYYGFLLGHLQLSFELSSYVYLVMYYNEKQKGECCAYCVNVKIYPERELHTVNIFVKSLMAPWTIRQVSTFPNRQDWSNRLKILRNCIWKIEQFFRIRFWCNIAKQIIASIILVKLVGKFVRKLKSLIYTFCGNPGPHDWWSWSTTTLGNLWCTFMTMM